MRGGQRNKLKQTCLYIFIAAFVCIIVLPILWLTLGSFKTQKELYAIPTQFFPASLRWSNYKSVLDQQPMFRFVLNSAIISLFTTVIVIAIGSMASYSLARVDIRGKKLILLLLLSATLLPPVTLLNPIYLLLRKVNLLNSYFGLSIALVATELPMAVWFLTSYFEAIPITLEESAMIDGANLRQMFTRILLPLLAPGTFTVSILVFISAWNNYIFASVFNPMPQYRTATVALTLLRLDEFTEPWELTCAASVIVTAPLILVVLLLQRRIVSGLMDGGIKG